MPFDPVTFTDADLLAVTVSVTDCPAEILIELAVIETTGFDPDPPPLDPLTVIVAKDGWQPQTVKAKVSPSAPLTDNFTLKPAKACK